MELYRKLGYWDTFYPTLLYQFAVGGVKVGHGFVIWKKRSYHCHGLSKTYLWRSDVVVNAKRPSWAHVFVLGPQLAALSVEGMELLGGRVLLQEVHDWGFMLCVP